MTWTAGAGLCILAVTLFALFRGYEVRLILLLAALALAALTQQFEKIVIVFFQGLADATSIVPICSAMGFAFVLKAFGCDRHLVQALSRPLFYARWLVIPGTIVIGFLVNITIISQTSTSLAVGTVLIPLLRSLGLPGIIVGSALLLGASLGGELLNPGAPELVAIGAKLDIKSTILPAYIRDVIFIHLGVAIAVYLWLNRQSRPGQEGEGSAVPLQKANIEAEPIRWLSAIVPVVPIVLLFIFGPPFNLFSWPESWLMNKGEATGLYSPRLIGLAMLCGCVVACLAVPRQSGSVARHFFEGAGYGYIHIISLIVIAKCFSEGIKLSGITDVIGHLAEAVPILLLPLAAILPAMLAFLSGSGIGATQGLYPLLADVALKQGVDPIHVGVLACIGAAAGRTMSIVAAVTIMCSQLTETKPVELSRKVVPPLCAGLLVLITIMMIRHLAR